MLTEKESFVLATLSFECSSSDNEECEQDWLSESD